MDNSVICIMGKAHKKQGSPLHCLKATLAIHLLVDSFRLCLSKQNTKGQTRTLCGLRHAYATLDIIENRIDNHTLMVEKHYSTVTTIMATEKLA
jgi:hypothetical protein